MSRHDVEVVRRLFEAFAQGGFRDARDVLDPQIVFARNMSEVPPGPGGAGVWQGIEQMWQAILDWLHHWDEVRHEAEQFIDVGDCILVLTRQTARGKLSGVPVVTELADIFTLREGRIVRWEIYWDRAEAMSAAGLDRGTSELG